MKIADDQLQPIRDIGDHLTFMFLPLSDAALITFQSLEQALQAKELLFNSASVGVTRTSVLAMRISSYQ